jgi:hypothetical protein
MWLPFLALTALCLTGALAENAFTQATYPSKLDATDTSPTPARFNIRYYIKLPEKEADKNAPIFYGVAGRESVETARDRYVSESYLS